MSDGSWSDAALVLYLTSHPWLARSLTLTRRLPPRDHALQQQQLPPITVSTQWSNAHRKQAGSTGRPSSAVHPVRSTSMPSTDLPPPLGLPRSISSPAATPAMETRSSSPSGSLPSSLPSSTSVSPTAPPSLPPPPLLYFLCGGRPLCLRFHTCPDYHNTSRRRASAMQKHSRPLTAAQHQRRLSSSALPTGPPPLYSSQPLDGCLVFLSTRDAMAAGSVLIAGIRPLLKRRKEGAGIKCDLLSSVTPFMVLGVDEKPQAEPAAEGAKQEERREKETEGQGKARESGAAAAVSDAIVPEAVKRAAVPSSARRLTADEGQILAADAGACGYVAVDLEQGSNVDEAVRLLLKAVHEDRETRMQTG